MIVKAFEIGCSKTINLQNYNSIKVEARLTIEVPDGEDMVVLRRQAQAELRSILEETYRLQMNPAKDSK